jgi:lipoprotein-anchoring transpeptidase ErfK/SrfK
MLKHRTIICAAIVLSSIAGGAQAQVCDERYPWTCRGYGAPAQPGYGVPAEPVEPRGPFPPFVRRGYGPYGEPTYAPPPYGQPYYRQPYPGQPNYGQPAYRQPPYADPDEPDDQPPAPPTRPRGYARPIDPALRAQYASLYARIDGEPFSVPAIDLTVVDPEYLRKSVMYPSAEPPGTIIIDAQNHFLYFVLGGGRALRYGVGVGRQGFGWSGTATIHDKKAWPDWYPPKEMLARQPELRRQMSELPSGIGMPGGPRNPLGSRAMYLWQGDKDTLYRIHGTVEPWTIGSSVSSGCIRMLNQDVIDLYQRASVGAKVVVLPARS